MPKSYLFSAILIVLLSIQPKLSLCSRAIHKVGDLAGWNIPTINTEVYSKWSKTHKLNIGDSLFFLYPPSQDSIIQVTKEAYNSCNLKNPIVFMNNGNSLFNITRPGEYYFTSGEDGHCAKAQKLHVTVYGNGTWYEASPAPDSAAPGPAFPTVFGGSIPMQEASSASSPLVKVPIFLVALFIGYILCIDSPSLICC